VAWPLASRASRSRPGWGGPRRRCRGSWPETAAATVTGPRPPTPRRASVPCGPRPPSWRSSRGCEQWWRPSWPCGGHRSRSPAGCRWPTSGSGDAGVARDDLPVVVRPEPGGAAPRAPALSAHGSGDALFASQAAAPGPRPTPRHPPHQPATRRGGRPGGAWPLGRRPDLRRAAQRGRDPGRAPTAAMCCCSHSRTGSPPNACGRR
jgi:hypothetical protein